MIREELCHMSRKNDSKNGITIIGLAVLIIVIIIMVVVFFRIKALFNGDPFTAFQKSFNAYASAINQDYLYQKSKNGSQTEDAKIYYAIARDTVILDDMSDATIAGTVNSLGLDLKPNKLTGINIFEIKSDTSITDVNSKQKFYDSKEKHYITDNGDVFFLPGYKHEEDGTIKWYVTDSKYYESDSAITSLQGIVVGDAKITSDIKGEIEAGTNLRKDTDLYISFNAELKGEKVTIEPEVPFKITKNGTYNFKVTAKGRVSNKTVVVNNYMSRNPSDILKVGDYISYSPDTNEYQTNKDNTGYTNRSLVTEKKDWRIIYVDKETENVLITTNGTVNSGIYLSGIVGFAKGVQELNTICKELYSNSKLGLTARCMTVEDANNAFAQKPDNEINRYAYYPRGITASGTITYNNNTYTKVTNDWRTSRFYSCDGGGIESADSNGIKFREPEEDNPVFVSQTFYKYTVTENAVLSDVLGKSASWLASQSVYASNTGAGFGIRNINANGINAEILYDSYANVSTKEYGIHPIIEIDSSKFYVDITDVSKDGSTPQKAWQIVKEDR